MRSFESERFETQIGPFAYDRLVIRKSGRNNQRSLLFRYVRFCG